MPHLWFSSWAETGRIALFATAAYVALLALVRATGKRVISKKNASDFIVTVAVGSAAASMALTRGVALMDGAVALTTFILLQFIVVSLTTHWEFLRHAIEGQPTLLVYRGELLRHAMEHEEVNESEVLQAIRNMGVPSVDRVYAVVLETDGSFSVVKDAADDATALAGVKGIPGTIERRSGRDRRQAAARAARL